MKLRSATTITALAVLAVSLFTGAGSADASIITMHLTGTAETGSVPVYGQIGSSIPFDFSLTYDTSLGSQVAYLPASSGEDLYGYSAAGITAYSLTFGTHSWTLNELRPQPVGGIEADFWTNADLTLGPPTKLAAFFSDGDGFLQLGHIYLKTGQDIFTTVRVNDEDPGFDGDADGRYTLSTTVAPTPVPEPASLLFVGSGLAALAARRRARALTKKLRGSTYGSNINAHP
jgi:hypothetical protein